MGCSQLLICAQALLHRAHRCLVLVLIVAAAVPSREVRAQGAPGQPGPGMPPPGATPAPTAGSPRPAGELPPPPAAAPTTTAQSPLEAPPPPPPAPAAAEQPTRVEWTPLPPESTPKAPATPRRNPITEAGLPVSKRGTIAIDSASFAEVEGDFVAVALGAVAKVPLRSRTFIDATLPLGIYGRDFVLGNPMLGLHQVFRPGRRLWITVGGAFGLPLLSTENRIRDAEPSIPRAYWNVHEYLPGAVPVHTLFELEFHAGPMIMRLQVEPAFFAPLGRRDDAGGIFQHGTEIQIGHTLGAGLRFQGVAQSAFDDAYQLAIEPFFVLERELAFLRLGIMMPLDEYLGPPFVRSWGLRLATGIRLE